jgi:CheY-like chemotaxis protein
MWNLLSNAIKFTPTGGQINVNLTKNQRAKTNYAQITVTDTGKGIPLNFLPYIFESFRQEDGSLTRMYGGLGLGLSISRQIIEMHSGIIWAESPGEGQGATFTVLLPLSSDPTPRSPLNGKASTLAVASSGALAGQYILVVDDDGDTRDYVVAVLEKEQAIVTAVNSGEQALEELRQIQPAVLLCDIGMPGMDGYSLIQKIRQLPVPVGQMPAIALTAYAGDQARQQALDAGFQQHLAKPVEPDNIVAAILQLMQTQRA